MTASSTERGNVPEWDLADRMSKALRRSGLGVSDIANALGVSRETIGRWINGRGEPKRAAVIAWAALTDCNLEWLETGQVAEEPSTLVRSYVPALALVADVVDLDAYRSERAA